MRQLFKWCTRWCGYYKEFLFSIQVTHELADSHFLILAIGGQSKYRVHEIKSHHGHNAFYIELSLFISDGNVTAKPTSHLYQFRNIYFSGIVSGRDTLADHVVSFLRFQKQ